MQNYYYGSLFLASLSVGGILAIVFGVLLVATAVFAVKFFISFKNYKKNLGSIQEEKSRMIAEATEESKKIKKEALLEVKEQEIRLRSDLERETKEKRAELSKTENRLAQKEESLDKKDDHLTRRLDEVAKQQENLKNKQSEYDKKLSEISAQHDKMIEEFEKIAQMSREEAKQQLIEAITEEAKRDAAGMVKNIEAEIGRAHV